MSADVEAAKEAVIAAAREWAAVAGQAVSPVAVRLAEASRALDAALAPPPPERRQQLVTLEKRPAKKGEMFADQISGLTYLAIGDHSAGEMDWVRVSVEPVGVNTVALEPGQYVVEVRAPVGLNERWFMQTGRYGENCDVIRGHGVYKHPVIVREFVAPTPETGAP